MDLQTVCDEGLKIRVILLVFGGEDYAGYTCTLCLNKRKIANLRFSRIADP